MSLKVHIHAYGEGFTTADERYIQHWIRSFAKTIAENYEDASIETYTENLADRISDGVSQPHPLMNRLKAAPCIDGVDPANNSASRIRLQDCLCIVENTDTKDYIVFTADERFHATACHFLCNEHCKAIYRSHYTPAQINWIDEVHKHKQRGSSRDGTHRVRPWMFPQYGVIETLHQTDIFWKDIYEQRKTSTKDIPLLFGGSGIYAYRKTLPALKSICKDFEIIGTMGYREYLPLLSRVKLGVSIHSDWDTQSLDLENKHPPAGIHEWCYRDAEYLAAGIPFIRQEFEDSVWGGSYVPNKHYISIPLSDIKNAFRREKYDGVAKLYKQKYDEVKDDKELLDFISFNQHELWKSWFSAKETIPKTIEIVHRTLMA